MKVEDLKIVNGDFAFGPDGEPLFLKDADAVSQDIAHAIEEAGVAYGLIGADRPPAVVLARMEEVTREDERVNPGTVTVRNAGGGVFEISATTMDGLGVAATVKT